VTDGGESGVYLIACPFVCALSLSNFLDFMILQLHRYEEEKRGERAGT